jgi:hypothetical protein
MDLTLAAATVLTTTTNATNATGNGTASGAWGGTITNETFGLWFVLLLILGVLVFLFWE